MKCQTGARPNWCVTHDSWWFSRDERCMHTSGTWNPNEPTQCCGYAIGVHAIGGPCPTEIEAMQRWGVM